MEIRFFFTINLIDNNLITRIVRYLCALLGITPPFKDLAGERVSAYNNKCTCKTAPHERLTAKSTSNGVRFNPMFFHKKTDSLRDQVAKYISVKEGKWSESKIEECEEWLEVFLQNITTQSVYDLAIRDIELFGLWLEENVSSNFSKSRAVLVIRSLLRFYRRFDILNGMANTGRKPNWKMIETVKLYRDKGLSYRDIQAIMLKKKKRKFDVNILHFWGTYNKGKLSTG